MFGGKSPKEFVILTLIAIIVVISVMVASGSWVGCRGGIWQLNRKERKRAFGDYGSIRGIEHLGIAYLGATEYLAAKVCYRIANGSNG